MRVFDLGFVLKLLQDETPQTQNPCHFGLHDKMSPRTKYPHVKNVKRQNVPKDKMSKDKMSPRTKCPHDKMSP